MIAWEPWNLTALTNWSGSLYAYKSMEQGHLFPLHYIWCIFKVSSVTPATLISIAAKRLCGLTADRPKSRSLLGASSIHFNKLESDYSKQEHGKLELTLLSTTSSPPSPVYYSWKLLITSLVSNPYHSSLECNNPKQHVFQAGLGNWGLLPRWIHPAASLIKQQHIWWKGVPCR